MILSSRGRKTTGLRSCHNNISPTSHNTQIIILRRPHAPRNRNALLRPQDDLRALLLDSEDPFVRLLAESNTAEEQASTLSPSPIVRGGGGGSNGGRSEAAVVAGSPPTPPPNHSSPGRLIRQRSERDARLANAATVSSRFRRC